MRLTVLGCSGSVPGTDSATSGYLLEADGFQLLIEMGNGTFANLQQHVDPFAVDVVLFSHLHLDHCGDFSALAEFRRSHPRPPVDPRQRRLPVYAPSDAPIRLAGAYAPDERYRTTTDFTDVFDFHGLKPNTTLHIGPFDIVVAPVNHICEAYGFRISHQGRSLAYSGDTDRCPEVVELATGADMLLADASWRLRGNRPERLHMSGRDAAMVANDAGAGQLLLTHVLPWSDRQGVFTDAAETFAGPVSLAEQGASYTI